MIDYISGKIASLSPTRVVVENQGIGYLAEISLQTYALLEGKDSAVIYFQQQINTRDGSMVDYGFAAQDERELFRLITSVSGMGASTARMILSSLSAAEFREAILSEDAGRLKSIKGLGLKSAQRLILELKDKMLGFSDTDSSVALFATERNAVADEASAALVMLGFSKPNVAKAIQSILKVSPNAKVEDIIKAALQIL
jgi:Holliday junction DNA helicase, RuvA subunit